MNGNAQRVEVLSTFVACSEPKFLQGGHVSRIGARPSPKRALRKTSCKTKRIPTDDDDIV